jgi:hypothetical protein
MSDTQYGFVWGNMEVERFTHIEGRGRTLSVRATGKPVQDGLQVYLSEGGRSLRVWYRGKELT